MIVVAGEALVDLVVGVDGSIAASAGGAPYNVARGCARLGAPTALMAALSGDRFGGLLAAGLSGSGVSAVALQRVDVPTTLAIAELDDAGAAAYRFYTEGTSAPSLAPAALPDGASTFVTGGLGLILEPMAATIESVVHGLGEDVLVVVDLNCRPTVVAHRESYVARLLRVLGRADVVKASDEDLAWLRPGVPAGAAADELLGRGAAAVLLTTGRGATTVSVAGATVDVPVEAVPVVDTIGAGDAFTAGLVTWWRGSGRGRADVGDVGALADAVAAAHAVAAVVVGRRGADPPRRHELPADWLR